MRFWDRGETVKFTQKKAKIWHFWGFEALEGKIALVKIGHGLQTYIFSRPKVSQIFGGLSPIGPKLEF